MDPEYATAYSNRGLIYFNLGQYQRAITDCNQAINLEPMDAIAYSIRGIAYNKLSRSDRACVDLWEACNLGVCDSLRLEQKKGYCRYPGGIYYVEKDDDGLYISTDKEGKFKITSKKVAASINPGTHGIYNIKKNNRGTYISTNRIGDFYIEPEKLSKEEARERSRQKAEWDAMWRETAKRDVAATKARDLKEAREEAEAKAERLEDTKDREREVVVVSEYRKPRYRGYYGYWNSYYPCHYGHKKPCYPHYPSPHGHWKPRKPRSHGQWKPRHPRSHGRKLSPESFKNLSIR